MKIGTKSDGEITPFFEISNEQNEVLIQANEIGEISDNYTILPENQKTTQQWTHLASDLVKGVSGIQGRTLELVFSPETQRMLDAGTATLKQSAEGTATVARNAQGQIKGHGLIVNSGKVKQLASGGFQLLSIVVAQSHLADIEKSLGRISSTVNELNRKWDIKEEGVPKTSIKYLLGIIEDIKYMDDASQLPQEKKHLIESIIFQILETENYLKGNLDMYLNKIKTLDSKDNFGASKTYEAVSECIGNIEQMMHLYDLILKLTFTVNYIKDKIDLTAKGRTSLQIDTERLNLLFGKALRAISEKSVQLLDNVTFSSNKNLMQWKSDISSRTSQIHVDLHSMQKAFKASVKRHITQQGQFPALNEAMRLAISFDENGEMEQIGVLNTEKMPA